jgi:hypothetical protein
MEIVGRGGILGYIGDQRLSHGKDREGEAGEGRRKETTARKPP